VFQLETAQGNAYYPINLGKLKEKIRQITRKLCNSKYVDWIVGNSPFMNLTSSLSKRKRWTPQLVEGNPPRQVGIFNLTKGFPLPKGGRGVVRGIVSGG